MTGTLDSTNNKTNETNKVTAVHMEELQMKKTQWSTYYLYFMHKKSLK